MHAKTRADRLGQLAVVLQTSSSYDDEVPGITESGILAG